MKTPHTLKILLGGNGVPRYDPVTDTYEDDQGDWIKVPCLIDVPREVTILEQYGTREEMDIIARFLYMPLEFTVAEWEGQRYTVVDRSTSGNKQSIRMRRVTR